MKVLSTLMAMMLVFACIGTANAQNGLICPEEILVEPLECGTYALSIPNIDTNVSVEWIVGGEMQASTTDNLIFNQDFGGMVMVTAIYTSQECGTTELATNFEAQDCGCSADFTLNVDGNMITATPESSQNIDTFYIWEVNGSAVSTDFILEYEVTGCGDVEVTLVQEGPVCNEQSTEMASVDCPCPETMTIEEMSCGEYMVSIDNQDTGVMVQWFVSGVLQDETGASISISADMAGPIDVFALYSSDQCEASEIEDAIMVPDCDCNASFTQELNDNMAVFTPVEADENGVFYTWSVNGSAVSQSYVFEYTFEECGDFEVCLTRENPMTDCLESTCTNIMIECDCPEAISIDNPTCGSYVFSIPNADPEGTVQWFVAGVEQASTETSIEVMFDMSGTYDIFAVYNDINCMDIELETAVEVPNCECDASYTGGVTENDGVFTPVLPFNEEFFYYWSVNGSTVFEGYAFETTFEVCGEYEVCLLIEGLDCEAQSCQMFDVECDNCAIDIMVNPENGDIYSFQAMTEATMVNWSVNGQFIQAGLEFVYEFGEGEFEVCAEVSDMECAGGSSACVDILNPGAADCTELTYVIAFESMLDAELAAPYIISAMDVNIEDGIVVNTNNMQTTVSACVADGCYNFDLDMGMGVDVAFEVMAYVNGDLAFTYSAEAMEQNITFDVGVNVECTDNVNQIAELSMNAYPNPANETLNIVLPNALSNLSLVITDARGSIVQSISQVDAGVNSISVAELANGMYTVTVLGTEGNNAVQLNSRVIVQH